MAAGSLAKVLGSGQGLPSTSAAILDPGTIDTDPDSILSESSGVFTPQEEGYYLIVASGRFDITHNNRLNIIWNIERNSTAIAGTGGSGYARNSTNPYVYVRAGAILHFNGTSDTFSLTHQRDTGAGTPAGAYNFTRLKVVHLADGAAGDTPYGRYGTPTSAAYSGTTPTITTGWDVITETDTDTIELVSGQDITLKVADRPYLLIYGLKNSDSGGARTTRISDVLVDGGRIHHSMGYAYQRDSSNQNAVPFGMALMRPGEEQVANVRCWGWTGESWGTFDDGSWVLSAAAAQAGIMVIALPEETAIAIYSDTTAGQTVSGSATTDINAFRSVQTEDSPFSRTGDTAVDVGATTDVLAWAGYQARRTATSTTRHTNTARFEVEGVDMGDTAFGTYGPRGDQGSQDTYNNGIASLFLDGVTSGDTFNYEKFDDGSDDGANDVTAFAGAFFIDLSTLAPSGGVDALLGVGAAAADGDAVVTGIGLSTEDITPIGTNVHITSAAVPWSGNHTLVAGDNRLIVVAVGIECDVDVGTVTATYGGVAMDEAVGTDAREGAGYQDMTIIFYLLEADLPSDGSQTVEVDITGSTVAASDFNAYVAEYENVDQIAPSDTDAANQSSGTTITNTITAAEDDLIVSVISMGNAGGSVTWDQSQNELIDFDDASSGFAVAELIATGSITSLNTLQTGSINRYTRSAAVFGPAAATAEPYSGWGEIPIV